MNTTKAIENLQLLSQELERAANSPKVYNTEFAYYLELMSFEMHKQANELKEMAYLFGDNSSTVTYRAWSMFWSDYNHSEILSMYGIEPEDEVDTNSDQQNYDTDLCQDEEVYEDAYTYNMTQLD